MIDLRLALLFMFIDAIVYLFGDRRHFTFSVWHDKIRQSLEPVVWSQCLFDLRKFALHTDTQLSLLASRDSNILTNELCK